MRKIHPFRVYSIFVIVLLGLQVYGQRNNLQIDYTVQLSDPATQEFHITTSIKGINEPRLDLSLPTWTPGWYTVENYFKNVLRFKITDSKGNRVEPQMIRKQTWRVETRGLDSLKVEFDYHAAVLALNQAKITN